MNKRLIWLLVVLVITALCLGGWLIMQRHQQKAQLSGQIERVINQELSGNVVEKSAVSTVNNPLAGQSWKIVSLVDGQEVIDLTDYDRRIEFTDDQVSGVICNNFSGQYKVTDGDNVVANGPLMSTKMACEPNLMMVEDVFLQGIANGFGYGLDEAGFLTLTSGNGSVLGFAKVVK